MMGDVFADPFADPFGDPFGDPFADPFGGPMGPGGGMPGAAMPPAGPAMEFSLDLNAMFGPAMPPMPGPGGPGGMGPGGPGMDPFIDPAKQGMTGFAIENDFAGMDDLFAIAGPEFGGYAPVGGPAGMPGPGGPAGMPGPMGPSSNGFLCYARF